MNRIEFKHLLFNVAFCAMTCDGEIDDREIEELKLIDTNTTYFKDTDLSEELSVMISAIRKSGQQVINDLFIELMEAHLTTVQELLILEVALRIINADEKIEENEKWFFRILRSKLRVHNEIIIDRFGQIGILFDKDFKTNIIDRDKLLEASSRFELPELVNLEKIDFDKIELC